MRIERHPIAPGDLRVRYDWTRRSMPDFLKGARERPNSLTLLASNALDLVAAGSVLEPDAADLPG